MTQAQKTQFERALAKATIEALHIIGRGTVKATGQQFYAVTSSDGTGCYPVIIAGHALVCSCQAGRNGTYCKHRALVTATLMEAARTAQAIADAEQGAANQPAPVCARCDCAAPEGYACVDCHAPLCAACAAFYEGQCSTCQHAAPVLVERMTEEDWLSDRAAVLPVVGNYAVHALR